MRPVFLRGLVFLACLWIGCGLAWAAPEVVSSRLPRDTTFIIDTSVSMEGLSIVLARQALRLSLERLQPSDWFNVIEPGSERRALFPTSVPADAAAVREALSNSWDLRDGDANLLPALQTGCGGGGAPSGLARQVVLITDGLMAEDEASRRFLQEDRGNCRVFVVGLGTFAARSFLGEVVSLGQGTFTHITELSTVTPQMDALFAQLESPMPQQFEEQPWEAFMPKRFITDPDHGTHLDCTQYVGPGPGPTVVWTVDGVVITDMEAVGDPPADQDEEEPPVDDL
jgi:Ca-activated chloride channel homolog